VVTEIEAAARVLERAGLARYEVSNYAKPGSECRHNESYWRLEPSIGVGPGAVSTLPAADGTALRLEATRQVDLFAATGSPGSPSGVPVVTAEFVPHESFLLEHFMMGLRRTAGIPVSVFRSRFDAAPAELAPRTVERWVSAGAARLEGDTLSLTDAGQWYLDSFLGEVARELCELTLRRA
jgi:oxygen-independent coproporphyrinogen-3 oxidase